MRNMLSIPTVQSSSGHILQTHRHTHTHTHTHIFVIALASFYSTNLILDSGTGTGRKIVQISDVEIEEDNRNALISFHYFTKCD